MATKSYKIRLDLRPSEPIVDANRFASRAEELAATQRWLDDTREAFNAGVSYLAAWLLKMHRGAGVWREKRDGIWRDWHEIDTFQALQDARERRADNCESFALLENRELLKAFIDKVKSEAVAVELAQCCRQIAKELCPPSEDSAGAQMPRDSLYLLVDPNSRALGIREGTTHLKWRLWSIAEESDDADHWQDKLKAMPEMIEAVTPTKSQAKNTNAGPRLKKPVAAIVKKVLSTNSEWPAQRSQFFDNLDRPEWLLFDVIRAEAIQARDTGEFLRSVRKRKEFRNAIGNMHSNARKAMRTIVKNGRKVKKENGQRSWPAARGRITKLVEKERRPYQQLLQNSSLPLPNFGCYHDESSITLGPVALKNIGSEWKLAMWNMAGQRVRSHLGWVRRREKERLIWELRTALFERGGWIRLTRNGKVIKKQDFSADDICFDAPSESEASDFERRPAQAGRRWVKTLQEYESVEMVSHLRRVAFGSAGPPRILKKTAKGWRKVRDKWLDLIGKAASHKRKAPSADELIEALNKLRARKSRDYGDQGLFEWLAASDRRWLWDRSDIGDDNDCGGEDRDCVWAFATHNEHLADEPNSITFTRSDPTKHPVWPFFGENSAVEYWLANEATANGAGKLVLILKQLLCRQSDGSYAAENNVRIALRGYADFEQSLHVPNGTGQVSPTEELTFRDDLLAGQTWKAKLAGLKLTWDRDELEAQSRKRKPCKVAPRIFANFSCEVGEKTKRVRGREVLVTEPPKWLTDSVGTDVPLKKPRDGMTRVFWLKKAISKVSAEDDGAAGLPPGQRKWPREAIDNGLIIRGADLGFRTSSAGAWWRLSFDIPNGKVAREVGKYGDQPVYAVLERRSIVLLPGDGEMLLDAEQSLRERLRRLRARLNLNNALLRIARLLTLDQLTRRVPNGKKMRKRRDGVKRPVGLKWITDTTLLDDKAIKSNCRKAAEQVVRWATTDAMAESLNAIGHQDSLQAWLAARNNILKQLQRTWPTTEVPTEKVAKEKGIDRQSLKLQRENEDAAFAGAVYELRDSLANALCDDFDADKRKRAKAGLWAEFDAALMRELSYGDRGTRDGQRERLAEGLFRLFRKPPVSKHKDQKDDANNLPHGKTYRGGLSMARLNFLDDVKNFVRRWSCRPRWPGDLRRVPENLKFDRSDTEHLDHLREHRAKLIAHADVAQTLGFEQDLCRGLWLLNRGQHEEQIWHRPERGHRYQWRNSKLVQIDDKGPSHPITAYDRAHVLVYEDLTRYRMSSDRPKNENAGLARWSHRRILSFAQHIGGLFGIPIAIVDARFSSRYCSFCGAPGCRADRFDPRWLDQSWLKRLFASTPTTQYDREMVKIASHPREYLERERPWVLRDGGQDFICANPDCGNHTAPINADENAAANVGLRFLRGVDAIRVTINGNGSVMKSIGYIAPGTLLSQSNTNDFWTSNDHNSEPKKKRRGKNASAEVIEASDDEDDGTSGSLVLFRDPSGKFRSPIRWFEGKRFWPLVAVSCATGLNAANASRFASEEDD